MSYEDGGVLRRLRDTAISLTKFLCVALSGDPAFDRKFFMAGTLRSRRLRKNVLYDLFFLVYVAYPYFPCSDNA
jgi:hypothetical protein